MQIKLEHLTKRFGDTVAVNDLSITLESGKLIALLGPSGCGKTKWRGWWVFPRGQSRHMRRTYGNPLMMY